MSHVLLFNCLYEVSLVVSGIMPSLVPHTRRNTFCSTRNALLQPPAHVYIGNDPFESTVGANVPHLPPFDGNIQPLDHTSPHKYPPASFVAAAACAASSPANTLKTTMRRRSTT